MSIEDTEELAGSARTPPAGSAHPQGRLRWRRFAVMMVASAAVGAALVVGLSGGAAAQRVLNPAGSSVSSQIAWTTVSARNHVTLPARP